MQQVVAEAASLLRALPDGPVHQALASRLEACLLSDPDVAGATPLSEGASENGASEHAGMLRRMLEEHHAQVAAAAQAQHAMDQQAAEYEQEARRLNELLHAAGIQPDSLPASCRDSLATLARMANELDVVVVSENSLAAAWGSLSVEDMKAARMQTMLQHKQSDLDRQLSAAKAAAEQLTTSMQAARQKLAKADKKLAQQALQYMPDQPVKLQKYRDQAALHQAQLDASGFKAELSHSALVERHSAAEQLQQDLRERQVQLEAFNGLQPSKEAAQRQLQLSKANLLSLQERLHRGLGLQG